MLDSISRTTLPSALVAGAALVLACALLPACGGGSSSGGTGSTGAIVYLRDAPPQTVLDQNGNPALAMSEMWLSVSALEVESTTGARVALTLPTSPYRVEMLSLSSAAIPFATGAFPAGTFTALRATLAAAEVSGVPTGSATLSVAAVTLPVPATFSAPFAAPLEITGAASLVLDWPALVSATTGGASTVYTLAGQRAAFAVGGSAVGSPAVQPVKRLVGEVVALDCGGSRILVQSGAVVFSVDLTGGTTFPADLYSTTPALPFGCASLSIGDEVTVSGTVQPLGNIVASTVRVNHAAASGHGAGGHHGSAYFAFEGVVRNRQSVSGGITFTLAQGSVTVVNVTTLLGTRYETISGAAVGVGGIQDGDYVQLHGGLLVQTPGATPSFTADVVVRE